MLRKFCIARRTEAVVVTCGSILNYFGTTVKLKITSPGNVNGFVGVRKQLRFLIIPLKCKHLNPCTLEAINAVRILKSMKISFGVDLGFASDYFKGYGTILRCLVCAFAQSVLPLTSWGNLHYTQVETPATKTFPSFDILHYRVRWPVGKIRTLSSSWKNVTSVYFITIRTKTRTVFVEFASALNY